MKAMILAAGLGTRLQPLTNDKPKALVEIKGKTELELVINRLAHFGFKDIIINVHHFADQIVAYLEQKNNFGCSITISDETDELLDTGGGIKKASWFFDDGQPFLVHNVDVYTDLDLLALYNTHKKANVLATLAVQRRDTTRPFLVNDQNLLCGWKNNISGEVNIIGGEGHELNTKGFSCIHVMDPKVFDLIYEKGTFSITHTYLRLAKDHNILTYSHDQDLWMDLGRKENLELLSKYLD